MEYDRYPQYFFDAFDTEEDFYKSTAPSEDIWKKFELLPTPPMSPTRTLSGIAPPPSSGDKLSWLSRVLGQDDEYAEGRYVPANLSSIIIRDCMWSSFSASKQLEKVSGARGAAPAHAAPPAARSAKAQCGSPWRPLPALTTDCVDPAAVLTVPPSGCRKQPSSGSESRSDSSDDDEEIDVVSVEGKQNHVHLVNVRKPVTITVRADSCPKRFHISVHRQQHNYAARFPDSEPEEEDDVEDDEDDDDDDDESDDEPQSKRLCTASSQDTEKDFGSSSVAETPQDSDVEDTDRRRNHNFLERKRRYDLRSRFLSLRDQIPGLEAVKTPKVAILTHATDYLEVLHNEEKRQLKEKRYLITRQQQLLRKLSELKRT